MAFTRSMWQQRNKIIFSNETFDGNKLLEEAIFLLWTWLRNIEENFTIPFSHWSSNLSSAFNKLKRLLKRLALTDPVKLLQEHNKGLDETYLREVAKEKKYRLVTMLECDEHDARP
ncbi:hypothetical protein GmHk_03G006826 [Glycine max]|nr:hypothetical protein GmHk_03G006826 [Glycine max]